MVLNEHVRAGPYAAAGKSKLEELQRAGITHIACVRQENEKNFIRPNFPDVFHYLGKLEHISELILALLGQKTGKPFPGPEQMLPLNAFLRIET
jgi:hypothetical protein